MKARPVGVGSVPETRWSHSFIPRPGPGNQDKLEGHCSQEGPTLGRLKYCRCPQLAAQDPVGATGRVVLCVR